MKTITIAIIGCALTFCCCKQASKSITDTIQPNENVPDDEARHKQQNTGTSSSAVKTTSTITVNTSSTTDAEHEEWKDVTLLTDAAKLSRAEMALRALPRYAGKEMFVYTGAYFFNDGSITISLRHPTNPAYVDRYTYSSGTWSAPEPVQLSVKDDIGKKLVSLNRIRFSDVATVVRIYNEKAAGIEGAKPVTNVYIAIYDNTMQWFPSTIDGSRERYAISFNTDGTLKDFHQE